MPNLWPEILQEPTIGNAFGHKQEPQTENRMQRRKLPANIHKKE